MEAAPSLKRTRSHCSSSSSYSSNHSTTGTESKTRETQEQATTSHPESDGESQTGTSFDLAETDDGESSDGKNENLGPQTLPCAQSGASSNSKSAEDGSAPPVVFSNGDWQAVYDPQTNAYYFANTQTGETTWTNPLLPPATVPESSHSQSVAADLGGLDPELAHLDPQLAKMMASGSSSNWAPTFTARFNSKTGKFEGQPSHDPNKFSEYTRARTQASAYFDVEGWERSLEKHKGKIPGTSKELRNEAMAQGKKLSKAQLNEFKEKRMEKKARRQRAWLVQ